MKRILLTLLAASLIIMMLSGTVVFAADYDDEYVYKFAEIQLAGLQVTHDPAAGYGYGSILTFDDASDPYFYIENLSVPSTQRYIAVKYATKSIHDNNVFVSADDDGAAPFALDWGQEGSFVAPGLITDGNWHLAIYDVQAVFPGVGDKMITTFRLPGAAAGDYIDIAYVGFFKTIDEANSYDADYSDEFGIDYTEGESPDVPPVQQPSDDKNTGNSDTDPNEGQTNPSSGDSNMLAMLSFSTILAATVIVMLKKRALSN